MSRPASHRLRSGRRSIRNHVYLCTVKAAGREPLFADLHLARIVVNELRMSDMRRRTMTLALVVMPDHFHWLMQLSGDASLSSVIERVKSFSARSINARLGRKGKVWQPGFHDHCVRRDESLRRLADYVVANPLRARLVTSLNDYPHWYTAWEIQ